MANSNLNKPSIAKIIVDIRKSRENAEHIINWVKHKSNYSTISKVIERLDTAYHEKMVVGEHPFPSSYCDIHTSKPFTKKSKHWTTELRWNLAILNKFNQKLQKYVALRADFGKHFLLGEYSQADEILDKVEQNISHSLWSLDKRFLLTQYREGFSSNKELLGEINKSCRNPIVNIIAHFFSLRVEPAIDFPSYTHLTNIRFDEMDKNGATLIASYFRSLLSFPPEISDSKAAYILHRTTEASMIDRLNAVACFCRTALAGGCAEELLHPFSSAISKLAIATKEPTLIAVTRHLGRRAILNLPSNYSQYISSLDSYTQSDYLTCIHKIRSVINDNPSAFSPYIIAAKAYAYTRSTPDPIGESNSIATQIIRLLTAIMIGGQDAFDNIFESLKLAVNLGDCHLAHGLYDFVFSLLGKTDPGERSILVELSSKFPDPSIEAKSNTQDRLSTLLKVYPESCTLKFLQLKSRGKLSISDSTLKVGKDRMEFYFALEQASNENHAIGIKRLEGIYERIMHLKDATFCELRSVTKSLFQVYIQQRKLEQACQLAVRSYERSTTLSLSLDLNNLLEELDKEENKNGNIYLPIISFMIGAEDFLTYKAVDRFLRSHSCKKATDLISIASQFPKGAFSILVGEVMTEDILALAWRYAESSDEVELQRIALCAYLVATEASKSAIYAEEAKYVTKRRSIRSALKHVGASKLRLDVPRMKKIFKDRMEPFFERRRAFLMAEKSGDLVQVDVDRLIKNELLGDEAEDNKNSQFSSIELLRESNSILDILLRTCYAIYLWDSDCCLNFSLSADVRHGFLKNHLRKPFQAQNIIFSKSSADGEYRINDFWIKQLEGNVSKESVSAVIAGFEQFSVNVDQLISSLNSKIIQVKISSQERARMVDIGIGDRLKGTENGYFDYESFFSYILKRRECLNAASSFDDFSTICFDALDFLTERNLESVRKYFLNDVSLATRRFCEELAESIRNAVGNPYLKTSLLKAISEARDSAVSEINEVAGWFESLDESQLGDTALNEIADVVTILLQSCHTKNLGPCLISCTPSPDLIAIPGASFSAIFDILYMLVENVAEHSSLPAHEVDCRIHISLVNGCGAIEVSNNLEDVQTAARHVESALHLLSDDSGVGTEDEGKSGLRKLRRIMYNSVGQHLEELTVKQNGRRFVVKVVLPSACICKSI